MNKKTRVRIGIVVVIIGLMSFSDWSFAEEGEKLTIFGFALDVVISALAWIWVFFAKLAGTFLTNKWVYGEILGLDTLLWKFWNIMKNIANFGLGFYFLYKIFGGLINGKEGVTKNLKNTILWLLIAGVGIQSSWFLTAAVIDVSTVTLVAAGSFPSQIISSSPSIQGGVKESIRTILDEKEMGKIVSLFPTDAKASKFIEVTHFELDDDSILKDEDKKHLIDALMPSQDDVSGPLYFIGFSILNADRAVTIDTSSIGRLKGSIFNALVLQGTTVIYSIETIMLCIVALMRIIYLWMFIVLSPIAILLWCIEKSEDKEFLNIKLIKSLGKHVQFNSFIINVFRPTFFVLGLGLSVIFVTLMNMVIYKYSTTHIGGESFDFGGATFSSEKDISTSADDEGNQTYTTSMDSNLFHVVSVHMGKTLLEIILSIITVIMVYYIIKMTMKLGKGDDFVSKRVESLYKSFESTVTSTPIIPFVKYDENGVKQSTNISLNALASIPGKTINKLTGDVKEYTAEQEDRVARMWGISKDTSLTSTEELAITNARTRWTGMTALENMKAEISKIRTEEGKGMTLNPDKASNNNFWINQFTGWLNNTPKSDVSDLEWGSMLSYWQGKAGNQRNLKDLFDQEGGKYATKYANFFGYTGTYSGFDSIKDIDISKK